MKPLFLIGYMASGKTTFGRALAKTLGVNFIDLDDYIKESEKATIPEIFSRIGEDGFRRLEYAAMRHVGDLEDVVVACGGGTACFFDNMEYMNTKGISVWLNASEDVLADRLEEDNSSRPLMKGKQREEIKETISRQLAVRKPYYEKCSIIFNSDRLENEKEIEESVRLFLAENKFNFDTIK